MLSKSPPERPAALLARAHDLPPARTAIVNAGTQLVMESARLAADENLLEPVLVGDKAEILRIAEDIDWNINDKRIVAASSEGEAATISAELAGQGEVDALMKGHVHSDQLLRAAFARKNGLRTRRRPSHVFHMTVPNAERPLCITDAVVNVLPSLKNKLDIARNARDLMHALGNTEPAIAVLSATEDAVPQVPSSVDAKRLMQRAIRGEIENARVSGPLSFDMAVSVAAARIKGASCDVAGNADVLLVPNIEAGNFLFKQMVYFMGATAAGVVVGTKVPIMLTSRADPAVARLASAALASVYANFLSAAGTT